MTRTHHADGAARSLSPMLLAVLANRTSDEREAALGIFYTRYSHDMLVLDKWFAVQGRDPNEDALDRVIALTKHEDFEPTNPNRLRALVSTFANFNPARFHDPSGAGYRFLADQVISLNASNPQIASRQLAPLTRWRKYDSARQARMQAQLQRILSSGELSADVYEVLSKSLA